MPYGPGKYDDECKRIRNELKADAVIVLAIGGEKGDGFSCQASPSHIALIASVMRNAADALEADLRSGVPQDAIKPREN